ncbi:MAG: ribosome biogenesis GTPase Der [Patescibacteria group bacterium]|jgi:GTP-binding protein
MATVALIGRPNVGKSSIFNRLIGQRVAIEAREAGTTRDRIFGIANYRGTEFTVIDVAGIDSARTDFNMSVREQIETAKLQADVVILILDSQTGILTEDQIVIDQVRAMGKPTIVVANKADGLGQTNAVESWPSIGFGKILPVSAIHNNGIDDLQKQILAKLPNKSDAPKQPKNMVKVAIIGRPNVGKSTLLNNIAGEQRAVVSNVAGTTRDNIDITLPYKEMQFQFIDTAGIRKRGKIEVGIEKFAVTRAVDAVQKCDVAFLLVNAMEGPTANDAHIAGIVLEFGKGLVIAVNKWDSYLKDFAEKNAKKTNAETGNLDDLAQREFLADLQATFAFIPWVVVIFISAADGLNVHKLLEQAHKVYHTRMINLEQSQLDNIATVAMANNGNLPLIYKIEQIGSNPPTFAVYVNRPQTWHFSQSRYIENLIRDHEPFRGTPIKVELVPYSKSQPKKH